MNNTTHIMLREGKEDSHIYAILLDTYRPKTDVITYVDFSRRPVEHQLGRYHALRNKTKRHPVTLGSSEERHITAALAPHGNLVAYRNSFSNPNRRKSYTPVLF